MAIKRELLSTVITESSVSNHKGWEFNFSKTIENGIVKSISVNGRKEDSFLSAIKTNDNSVSISFNGCPYDNDLSKDIITELAAIEEN